jgi:chaperonin GroES
MNTRHLWTVELSGARDQAHSTTASSPSQTVYSSFSATTEQRGNKTRLELPLPPSVASPISYSVRAGAAKIMIGFLGAPLVGQPRPNLRAHGHRRSICRATAAVETHDLDGQAIGGPLHPVGQNILVKVAKANESTAGGLILATSSQDKPTYGTAVAVGPGKYFPSGGKIPMSVSQGDTVMYGKYGGTDVKYDGEKHTIIQQDDVLCTLERGEYSAESVRPVHDRLLVQIDTPAEELKSGILISAKGAEKPTTGTVVAIGSGRVMENGDSEPVPVSPGDKVLYGQYSGTEIRLDDVPHIFIRVADVFAHWSA